jgi:phosphoglycerate dehydrogenase-like enzyme
MVRFWVPTPELASALEGLAGAAVEVVVPDGSWSPGAADVEFYVPPFFPSAEAVAAIGDLPRLRVVQTLTAGVDKLLPRVPAGVLLCNARGAHDASTAEWVVAAILASLRSFPYFSTERAGGGATSSPTAWQARPY